MRPLLAALALAAVAFAGCASSDGPTTTSSSTTEGHHHDMTAKTVDVAMQGNSFVNNTVTIYEGDTVRWTHRDGNTPHNVHSDDPAFDSRVNCKPPVGVPLTQVCMVNGDAYSYRFDQVGDVSYRCDIHSGMTGTVHVLAHPM